MLEVKANGTGWNASGSVALIAPNEWHVQVWTVTSDGFTAGNISIDLPAGMPDIMTACIVPAVMNSKIGYVNAWLGNRNLTLFDVRDKDTFDVNTIVRTKETQ